LKHPVLDFCYPSGRLNAGVIRQVEAAGFQSATTTAAGTAHSQADRLTWSRVRVQGGESLATFVQNLGPVERAVPIAPAPAATAARPTARAEAPVAATIGGAPQEMASHAPTALPS